MVLPCASPGTGMRGRRATVSLAQRIEQAPQQKIDVFERFIYKIFRLTCSCTTERNATSPCIQTAIYVIYIKYRR